MVSLPADFNNLLKSYGWNPGATIKIGFTLLPEDQDLDVNNIYPNKAPIADSSKQQQILNIFNLWGTYTNLNFVIDNSNPQIRIGTATFSSSSERGHTLNAFDGSTLVRSEIYISNEYIDYGAGPGGFFWMMHEIGHALGLADINGIVSWDNNDVSVMAYDGGQYTSGFNRPENPMIYDIYAIQQKYGVNTNFNNGNNSYTFTGVEKTCTIWDGGGTDTLDASTQTSSVTLDLREGFDDEDNQYVTKVGNERVFNAFHANIENAKAGSGDDFLYGNDKQEAEGQYAAFSGDNKLEGGAGNDTLVGGTGNDIMDGGADYDTVKYDDRTSGIEINILETTVATPPVKYQVESDTITNVESIIATSGNDTLNIGLLTNTKVTNIDAGNGNDTVWVFGSEVAFNPTIDLGAGDDVLKAAPRGSIVYGGAGADSFEIGSDYLIGDAEAIDKITYQGKQLYGGVTWKGQESAWAKGLYGIQYGYNSDNELVIKDLGGKDTYVAGFTDQLSGQTAGIRMGEMSLTSYRLFDAPNGAQIYESFEALAANDNYVDWIYPKAMVG